MEMGFSALLSPQNTEQSKCNQINVFFWTIQNMNMKGFYLGLEDPSTGHKSTIDLLLNIHTQVLSFKQDSSALENATTLMVTIELRNISKAIIVWETGITNYTIWNGLNSSERSKWVGLKIQRCTARITIAKSSLHVQTNKHKLSHNFRFCISGESLKSILCFAFFISVNSF